MKKTKQQIGEAICRWSAYLLENKMATKEEIDSILDESIFKRAKAAIKGGLSRVGSGIASAAKGIGRAIHDEFAANPGVKDLMKNVHMLIKDKHYDGDEIKFYVFVKALKQTFPVADFALSKNRKTLVLQFKDKSTKPKTYEELHDFLRKSGFDGKKVKISDYVDSLAVGQLEDDIVLESAVKEADTERIAKVVNALGWSAKHALTQKSLQKIAALFGIKGENAAADVKEVVKEYFDTKSSSDDEEEKETNKKDDKSSDDNVSPDEETPDFEKDDKNNINDELLKTKTGKIGVMSCPFKEIRVQSNKIGVIFGDTLKNDKRKKDMEELVS